ncbi:MAG: IS630 family transposase [Magnetococcus sp. WYHC-3]
MQKPYRVILTLGERAHLNAIINKGKGAAMKLRRARMLLKADEGEHGPGWTDQQICDALDVSPRSCERLREQFVEEGFEASLERRPTKRAYRRKIDGDAEAHMIAMICHQEPPKGYARWSVRLIADQMVELGIVESTSKTGVHKALKKNELKPWLVQQWCTPPKSNAEFVSCMEDVLDVYKRPYDSRFPVVCLDETSKQLISEVRVPVPASPGQPARKDYEYQRNGVASLFMVNEPLQGKRHVRVTEKRGRLEFAECVRELADEIYPGAERIVLVMDHLNTHTKGSLYEAFSPQEAKRIADRLEIHYTPKHGSWLNMAEIELGILTRQCLSRRIETIDRLRQEVSAWESKRNRVESTVDWQFTVDDARIKLKRLYPSL